MTEQIEQIDGAELSQLVNELKALMLPLNSKADNVYLYLHADGVWRFRIGRMLDGEDVMDLQGGPDYPTLPEAMRALCAEYRACPTVGGTTARPNAQISQ